MKKRILSIVLSIVMLVSLLPTAAFATDPAEQHIHAICGKALTTDGTCGIDHDKDGAADSHGEITWTPLSSVMIENENGFYSLNPEHASVNENGTRRVWSQEVGAYVDLTEYWLKSGNYYVDKDMALDCRLKIESGSTVSICLNGKKLYRSNAEVLDYMGEVIFFEAATLNLCDCGTAERAGFIDINENESCDHLWTETTESVNPGEEDITYPLYGGLITGGHIEGATLNMYGGNVAGVQNRFDAAVAVEEASIYNGAIVGNYNFRDGALRATTLKLYDVTIAYNRTDNTDNGAVYTENGWLYGGEIVHNWNPHGGPGGLELYGSTLHIFGGRIENNTTGSGRSASNLVSRKRYDGTMSTVYVYSMTDNIGVSAPAGHVFAKLGNGSSFDLINEHKFVSDAGWAIISEDNGDGLLIKPYILTFNLDDGSLVEIDPWWINTSKPQEVGAGQIFKLYPKAKDGYRIKEMTVSRTGTQEPVTLTREEGTIGRILTMPASDVTVTVTSEKVVDLGGIYWVIDGTEDDADDRWFANDGGDGVEVKPIDDDKVIFSDDSSDDGVYGNEGDRSFMLDVESEKITTKTRPEDCYRTGIYSGQSGQEKWDELEEDWYIDPDRYIPVDLNENGKLEKGEAVKVVENADGSYTEDTDDDGIADEGGMSWIPDQDGDGKAEPDTDDDGIYEGTKDTDNKYVPVDTSGDGKADKYVDSDSVTDGIYTDPETGKEYKDSDGDGVLEPQKSTPVVPSTPSCYNINVNPSANGDVDASRTSATSGTTITLTVDPNFGYELDTLSVSDRYGNKISLTEKANGTYTFRMPAEDVWVDAAFKLVAEDGCSRNWTCPMYGYSDLNMSLWYHDGIHYCLEHGLMNGVGDNLFAPNGTTTRAMIVTILWRLEGSPVVDNAMDFQDVPAEQWYTEAIRWAASEKIAEGYGNGKFGTNEAITREQMVTILYRYAQNKGYDVSVDENTNLLSYGDAFNVADWAIPAMQWACDSGMIQGMAEGSTMNLQPQGNATRAQAAAILQRFCENVANG